MQRQILYENSGFLSFFQITFRIFDRFKQIHHGDSAEEDRNNRSAAFGHQRNKEKNGPQDSGGKANNGGEDGQFGSGALHTGFSFAMLMVVIHYRTTTP